MSMNQQGKTDMYPVHCTECGETIEGKFFPLDDLLRQYSPGDGIGAQRDEIIWVLGIGALYGTNILPKVPKLLHHIPETEDTPESWEIVRPDLEALRSQKPTLQRFSCKDNNHIPMDKLVNADLTMASMVAQFCISTGFDEIYDMLELQNRIEQQESMGELAYDEKKKLDTLCEHFIKLPGVRLSRLTTSDMQRGQIVNVLSSILSFAHDEAEDNRSNYASEPIQIGWRYQLENGIQMPYSLVAVGSTSKETFHCSKCCCDKCRRELPYEIGAYPQRIIGILGTQATGKTTYLAALSDAIDCGEATSYIQSNGDQQQTNITITHSAQNDPQWKRVLSEPTTDVSGESKIGALWLYKNGYPPQKTKPEELEAPALNFLVSGSSGTIMYTLADIAGEAFTKDERYAQYLEKMRKLLYSSDALMMVISTGQMSSDAKAELNRKLILDPNEILTYYKDFLPNHPIPTAVVMTSSDKINGGDLRQPLNLAYDIRRCRPLVWDGRKKHLVYNVEAMSTSVQAVWAYINKFFGNFMKNLSGCLSKSGTQELKVAAFAVSSGTQCAKYYFGDPVEEQYHSIEQREARYAQVRRERFGVTAPLLWLLACDGMLEIGRADTEYSNYTGKIQTAIANCLKNSL